jgi:raffinose/stachyose/melibiose transport system permease protein
MTRDEMRTVPLAIIPFIGQFGNQTEYMFATLLLISVPPLLLFVLLQRYFQIGLTAGSVKGQARDRKDREVADLGTAPDGERR